LVIGPDVTLFDAGYCHISSKREWTAGYSPLNPTVSAHIVHETFSSSVIEKW